ncbi:hypothetical protein C2857_001162 [Epichloe festucae Fl1]|uniref:GPI anchored serine-threonine rich protein n=1 Tax=Epichloe festucae (strain Fl1) TaxID=877507 RepID=A0A7S9KU71_EPIFF|nr:hypothetical protein C2857_001162 [Epichloe festucae Fl1]
MKSFFPIAFIAGVSAQSLTSAAQTSAVPTASVVVQIPPGGDQDCLANYIVKQCLQTESDKLAACSTTDYQCICYASQAIATCYNNCPNDSRAPQATQSMNAACAVAAQHSSTSSKPLTTATATNSSSSSSSSSSDSPNPTDVFPSYTFSAGSATKTSGAESLVGNAAGLLAAMAGVVAAAL